MVNIKKKLLPTLLSVLMMVTLIPAVITAETTKTLFRSEPESVHFYKENEKGELADEVLSDTVLDGKKDNIYVVFHWDNFDWEKIVGEDEPDASGNYVYSLGDYGNLFGKDSEFLVHCVVGSGKDTIEYGELNIVNGELLLTLYKDKIENDPLAEGINNVTVTIRRKLSLSDEIEDEKGKVVFEIPLQKGVNLEFIDNEGIPKEPSLTKDSLNKEKSKDDKRKMIDEYGKGKWSLTFTAPGRYYTDHELSAITDAIPEHMDFVDGSFRAYEIDSAGTKKSTDLFNVKLSADGRSFSVSLLDEEGKPNYEFEKSYVFEYETIADELTILSLIGALKGSEEEIKVDQFKNTANILDTNNEKVLAQDVEATIYPDTLTSVNTVIKKQAISVSADKRTINWEIEVLAYSLGFDHLYVIDTMGAALELDKNTIVVSAGGDSYSYASGTLREGHEFSIASTTDTKPKTVATYYLICTKSDGMDSEISKNTGVHSYKINYTTKVKEDFFKLPSIYAEDDLVNTATLNWAWKKGGESETVIPLYPPTVTKSPDGIQSSDKVTLIKNAYNYDSEKHILGWKIEFNHNLIPINSFDLRDDLNFRFTNSGTSENKYHHELYKIGSVEIVNHKNQEDADTQIRKALEVYFGEGNVTAAKAIYKDDTLEHIVSFSAHINYRAKKEQKTIEVYSKIYEGEFNASNRSNHEFYNDVTMSNIVAGGAPYDGTLKDDATQKHNNTILSKTVTGVSGTDENGYRNVTWKLTINQQKTELTGVTVYDFPPEKMTYADPTVPAVLKDSSGKKTAEIFPEMNSDGTVKTVEVDGKNAIVFKLGGIAINGQYTLEYVLKYDVNDFVSEAETISFKNKATLISDQYQGETKAEKEVTIGNIYFEKNAGTYKDTVVPFVVTINPIGINLTEDGLTYEVRDEIPAGATIDISSVKLYRAKETVKANSKGVYVTTLTKDGEALEGIDVTFDSLTNKLTVVLPDLSREYILEYNVYVLSPGITLVNKATLDGVRYSEPDEIADDKVEFMISSHTSAEIPVPSSKYGIRIVKKDADGKLITNNGKDASWTNAKFVVAYLLEEEYKLLTPEVEVNKDGYAAFAVEASEIPEGIEELYILETKSPDGYPDPQGYAKKISLSDLIKGKTVAFDIINAITDITVKKIWKDDVSDYRGDYTVTLYMNGKEYDSATLGKDVLEHRFTDLPVYKDGEKIDWTVKETAYPGLYTIKSIKKSGDTFTITNELNGIRINKTDKDGAMITGEGKGTTWTNAKFMLLNPDGSVFAEEMEINDKGFLVFPFLVKDIPADVNELTLVETKSPDGYPEPEGYAMKIKTEDLKSAMTVFNVVNAQTEVTVKKIWDDGNVFDSAGKNYRGSYEISLYADGELYKGTTVVIDGVKEDRPAVVTLENDVTEYTFKNLPVYRDGKEIVWTVDETRVPEGYTKKSVEQSGNTFTITNVLNGIRINKVDKDGNPILKVEKYDEDGNMIAWSHAKFMLLNPDGSVFAEEAEVNEEGYLIFPFVPTEEKLQDIVELTLMETRSPDGYPEPEGYAMKIDTSLLETGKVVCFDVINDQTEISFKKVWDDDGAVYARNQYEVSLYANGVMFEGTTVVIDGVREERPGTVVMEKEDTEYTFKNLPVYLDGKEIEWTVKETKLPYDYFVRSIVEDKENKGTFIITNTLNKHDYVVPDTSVQ